MKLRAFTVGMLGAAVLATGCWPKSVFPFYQEKDVIADPALVGKWRYESDTWTFTAGAAGTPYYRLRIESEGTQQADYDARLFLLGTERCLDLHSRDRSISAVPAHHLLRVSLKEGILKMQLLNPDWLLAWLRDHPDDIPHVRTAAPAHPNDPNRVEIILAGNTEQLQKFVRAHWQDEKAWSDPVELKMTE